MKIPPNVFEYIRKECESVDFGVVRIEINARRGTTDIVTERRERFELPSKESVRHSPERPRPPKIHVERKG